jgi:hypothetical protein
MKIKTTGKILFLHGLEAGLNGNKSNYLRKEFPNCTTPDFQVSKFKIWLKNSFLRNILTSKIFLLSTSSILLASIFICMKFNLLFFGISFGFISFFLFLILAKNSLIRNAVKKSMENNIQLSKDEIIKNKPDVIIGSSWGAAVLVNLIERDIWKGNSIMIAPAYYSVNKVIFNNNKNEIYKFNFSKINNISNDFIGKIIVYHSKEDTLIPFRDSEILCGKNYYSINEENKNNNSDNNNSKSISDIGNFNNNIDIIFKVYEKGGHPMNELLEEPENILKNDIINILNSIYENKENEISGLKNSEIKHNNEKYNDKEDNLIIDLNNKNPESHHYIKEKLLKDERL